jgi:hypothetical protein
MTSRYEELLLPEQRERIVAKVVNALKSKGQLSAKTINDFRDVFKAGKPIPGFNNDPLKAFAPLLKQHMLERIGREPDLEHLIVGVWADIEPQMRVAVNEHLDSLGRQIYDSDEIDEDFWDAQVSLLTEKHDGYDEDDILLMTKVCYANAKIHAAADANAISDAQSDGEDEEGDAADIVLDTAYGTLSAVLDRLRTLPAESEAWQQEIPQFAKDLSDLMSVKEEERNRLDGLLGDLEDLQSAFASDLGFFGRSAESWNFANLATSAAISEAARMLADLETALEDYRAISERAETLAEERGRRERRNELEDDIERMLSEIDELSHAAAIDSEPTSDLAEQTRQQAQSEAASELRQELNALRGEYNALLDSNRAIKRYTDSSNEEKRALQDEVTGLNADKQALADEVAKLKDQLQISEAQELRWRNAYETEMSNKDSSAPEPIPSEVESVKQATGLAQARYGDKLLFQLNKKSDRDYYYNRPKEVWDALEWLATTYHKSQTGEERVIDLNESIRNTCGGWEYKPNQNDIIFNRYREWYTTSMDGITYELRKHIGKGTGRDGNIIRIAFNWDEDSQRVIVGYIGPHQRNRV